MTRYVLHPNHANLPRKKKFVEKSIAMAAGWIERPVKKPFQIMSDSWIEYESIVDDSHVSGRVAHREHLRQNNCEEIGSEKPDWMRERQQREAERAPAPIKRKPDPAEAGDSSFDWEPYAPDDTD